MYPDSADNYVELIKAVDRARFAVHLDPANLVCSPQRYFYNGAIIRECCEKLGPLIRSCHAKDVLLAEKMTVHIDEVRPGLGGLHYCVFLREVAKLHPDTPLMLEHLATEEEYDAAAAHIRSVAKEVGVTIG
jgi:sugar phosphate isomerase/epimerase